MRGATAAFVTPGAQARWAGMTKGEERRRQRDIGMALLIGAVTLAVLYGATVLWGR